MSFRALSWKSQFCLPDVIIGNSFIKDSVVYVTGAVLTKALGFFLIPLYTRYFTVEEYAILSLLNIILQLLTFVLLLGISSAAMRFYFNPGIDDAYRRKLYGNAFLLLLILPAALSMVVGPLIYLLVSRFLTEVPFFPYVLIVIAIGLFTPISKLMIGMLRVKKRAKTFVMYNLAFFLTQAVVIIINVAVLGYGLKGQLYAQLLVNIVFWIIAAAILKKNSDFAFSWNTSKNLLAYGVPLIPYFIFLWINTASGSFMLGKYAGMRELGIFALAMQFSGILALFGQATGNALQPHFYETAQKPEGTDILGRFATKYFAFFGIVSIFILIIAEPMVLVMADSRFHDVLKYIPMLLFSGWLTLVNQLFIWSLMNSNRTGVLSNINIVSCIMLIGLLFFFLKYLHMGISGVVYSMIVIGTAKILATYCISQKYFRIKFRLKDIAVTFVVMVAGAYLITIIPVYGFLAIGSILLKFLVLGALLLLVIKIAKIESLKKFILIKF